MYVICKNFRSCSDNHACGGARPHYKQDCDPCPRKNYEGCTPIFTMDMDNRRMYEEVEVFTWESEGGGFEKGLCRILNEGWKVMGIESKSSVIHVYAAFPVKEIRSVPGKNNIKERLEAV